MYEEVLLLLRGMPPLSNTQAAEALSCETSQKLDSIIKDARKRIEFENIDPNCTDIVLMAELLKLGVVRSEDIVEKFKEKGRERTLKQVVFIKQEVNILELQYSVARMNQAIEQICHVFEEMDSIFTKVEDVDYSI